MREQGKYELKLIDFDASGAKPSGGSLAQLVLNQNLNP
jgi:hypothetical protein